jgi:hypothetical protein
MGFKAKEWARLKQRLHELAVNDEIAYSDAEKYTKEQAQKLLEEDLGVGVPASQAPPGAADFDPNDRRRAFLEEANPKLRDLDWRQMKSRWVYGDVRGSSIKGEEGEYPSPTLEAISQILRK